MNDNNQIIEQSWDEFKNSRLLWWVNRVLHLFGWAIVMEMDKGKVTRVYPAKVKFRGFSQEVEERNFKELTEYLAQNIGEIAKYDEPTKH